MKDPLVSVIIPVYNRAGLVGRAVDSVLGQTWPNFELIVVDDGSTDRTPEVLAGYGDRLTLLRQPHSGVSAARNRGLAAAQGDLIAFLDSDDYWDKEKIEAQVRFFQEHPEAIVCQTEEVWVRRGRRVNPGRRHRKPSGEAFFSSLELCLISPSAVMMKRELFDQVGLFDEDLPAAEDYDLWLRVTARHPVWLIERPLVVKTGGHPDQLSRATVGLDQYRVMALQKILRSGTLSPGQARAARTALARKARVYGRGCLKRGRTEEGRRFLDLVREYGESDGEA
ncbi:MAG: glycosyltransferase [Thermodesulfobacteriota bacterium]